MDDIEICEYSYLGSSMPLPDFPKEIKKNVYRVDSVIKDRKIELAMVCSTEHTVIKNIDNTLIFM